MTAVEYLIEHLKETYHLTEETLYEFKQAKEIEKQQRKNAQMDMFNHCNDVTFGMEYLVKRELAEQYADDYGKAESDEIEVYRKELQNEKDRTKTEEEGFAGWLKRNYFPPTPSQTEISDEEIENEAERYEKVDGINAFKEAIKWYREQLKNKL